MRDDHRSETFYLLRDLAGYALLILLVIVFAFAFGTIISLL